MLDLAMWLPPKECVHKPRKMKPIALHAPYPTKYTVSPTHEKPRTRRRILIPTNITYPCLLTLERHLGSFKDQFFNS